MTAFSRPATPTRLAPVIVALVVLAGLVSSFVASGPARAMGPLPACRYDDITTAPRSYADWAITLVDTILRVSKTYVPPDLVPVTDAGLPGKGKLIRAVAIDDLREMTAAAKAAGAPIGAQSAYRSYASQQAVFQGWVSRKGRTYALTVSARPGHSEHQLGLAIDFRSVPTDDLTLNTDWQYTKAGKWMAAHAWEYGWLMSYPKGRSSKTCYSFEPWHFRYVGRELAAAIHQSGLTIREYLWANFTTALVPAPSGAPGQSAKPTGAPTVVPTLPLPSTPPTSAPTTAPSPTPTTGVPSPGASAVPQPTPDPGGDVIDTSLATIGGLLLVIGIGAAAAWLALRRGRSGVGL
jgi:D-alanyl-D-alanine carboxypeptidase